MTEEKRNQKTERTEVKTFPVPFALRENQENITINTNTPTQPSKEQIINQAFKFHSQANISEAAKLYQYFINQGFKDHRVFSNYGNILKDRRQLKDAEFLYRKAIEFKPDFSQAHYNLGIILKDLGNLTDAELSYRKAIKFNPDYADAHLNLGNIFKDLGNFKDAELSYRKAIKFNPDYADAHLNLGNILKDLGNLQDAELSYRKAIKIKPDYADAHLNLGNILKDLGNLHDAELSTRKAIEIKPDSGKPHWNLSHILLKQKKFEEGWEKYEWRWKVDSKTKQIGGRFITNKPEWRSEKKGRVLLWAEQGLGDQILYCSLIPDFLNKVDKIILKVDKRLIPLLKRSVNNNIKIISEEESINEKEYDYHLPIGSLGGHVRKTVESFDSLNKLSLVVNKEKAQQYKTKLLDCNYKKLVGISWTSKSKIFNTSLMSLKEMISGIYSPGIKFINLQYGDVKEEINNVIINLGVEILDIEELDYFNDIDGLAALITACDEIVTIDNITATISGALGVNTKVIIPTNSYWAYGVNDKQSYWFPSIKIFRQIKRNDWSTPLDEIRKEIGK